MLDDDAYLSLFAATQAAEGCSRETIRERDIALRAMWRRTETSAITVTRHDLIRDLGREGISQRTRANYRSLYHTFFTWLQDEEYRSDNPSARLPRQRYQRQEANPVETEDIEFLLGSGIYGRTRMYVLLYAYQGFRAVEIAAASGEAIDWKRKRILSVDGKGGKEVWRPIHPLVWEQLQRFPRTGWLFPSRTGGHVHRKSVSNVLSKAFQRAGLVGHRPHNLRAWFATMQLEAGVSGPVVQATMRHTDAQSMRFYHKPSESAMRAAIESLPVVVVPERSGRRAA